MPHPEIVNRTPFCVTPLFLADAAMRPLLVPLVRATFALREGAEPVLHERQLPPELAGQHWGDPLVSSYRFEPECAWFKPATDVVLIGRAHAPRPGTTQLDVGLRVGPLQKVVRVQGDRILSPGVWGWSMSPARPFETIPLVYERAFGGWDRSDPDPARHRCEPRNPVGTGYRSRSDTAGGEIVMPNIEDPAQPYTRPGTAPPPAGFGFIAPHWQPRAARAGTYDEAWSGSRKPLLPADFDPRFLNAASPGLVAPGYLAGGEPVLVAHASAGGRLAFTLPAVASPLAECELTGGRRSTIATRLDTVIIDTDTLLLHLLWRGQQPLRDGPHQLVAMDVACMTHAAPARVEAAA